MAKRNTYFVYFKLPSGNVAICECSAKSEAEAKQIIMESFKTTEDIQYARKNIIKVELKQKESSGS